MNYRGISACFGASTGFSLVSLAEFIHRVDWVSLIGVVGSIASTAIGWYLARRQELVRATIQLEHDARQARRDELLEDLATDLRVRRAREEAGLPPSPGTV